MFRYSINIVWSDTDESYVATILEFPGFSAFGSTPEKAIKEAITACELFIEDMIEVGEEIPKPVTLSLVR
ncbi:MAG: type II toxin-antitoxin system HicB family antitoxin [Nitrospirae bacterium]|nr:type II toxin-antitoxin system HicB family antitoxin [Nitrospirota bacterium]